MTSRCKKCNDEFTDFEFIFIEGLCADCYCEEKKVDSISEAIVKGEAEAAVDGRNRPKEAYHNLTPIDEL